MWRRKRDNGKSVQGTIMETHHSRSRISRLALGPTIRMALETAVPQSQRAEKERRKTIGRPASTAPLRTIHKKRSKIFRVGRTSKYCLRRHGYRVALSHVVSLHKLNETFGALSMESLKI